MSLYFFLFFIYRNNNLKQREMILIIKLFNLYIINETQNEYKYNYIRVFQEFSLEYNSIYHQNKAILNCELQIHGLIRVIQASKPFSFFFFFFSLVLRYIYYVLKKLNLGEKKGMLRKGKVPSQYQHDSIYDFNKF